MTTIFNKLNDIDHILNKSLSMKNDEQLIKEISQYLKQSNTRTRAKDEEILMWLLENDKVDVFVKLLLDHEIFGSSSIEMLLRDKQKPTIVRAKSAQIEDTSIQLDGKLLSKVLEKIYTISPMQHFFKKVKEINALTMSNEHLKLSHDIKRSESKVDDNGIKADLQRILNELHYSIYAGDLSYIRHLMSFLPPSLRNTMPISRFIEAINEQKVEQSLEEQRASLYDDARRIIEGCRFHKHLNSNDPMSMKEADEYIIALMGFGIGVGYHLIKDSEKFLGNFENALTKSNFKEVRDLEGNTLLHKAAAEGQLEVVDKILRLHADKKINLDIAEDKNIYGHNVEECVKLHAMEEEIKVQLLQILADAKSGNYKGITVQENGKITPIAQSFSR